MLCPNSEFPSSDAGHPGKRDQNSVMFLRKEVFNLDTITFLTDKVWEEFGDAKVGTIHVRFTVLYKGPGRDGALYPTHSTLCLSVSLSHPPLHHPLPPSITHSPTLSGPGRSGGHPGNQRRGQGWRKVHARVVSRRHQRYSWLGLDCDHI